MDLSTLVKMSNTYGSNPAYVLAGGGNTSVKDDTTLYVKGSGTQLATIKAEEFVEMSRARLNEIMKTDYPEDDVKRESLYLADVMAAVTDADKTKRPRVEALLHNLFAYTYVLHVHPTLVNGLTCGKGAKALSEQLIGALFDGVISKLEKQVKRTADVSDAVTSEKEQAAEKLSRLLGHAVEVVPAAEADHFVKDKVAAAPLLKPFTPDHIVYCGPYPLFVENIDQAKDALDAFMKENDKEPRLILVQGVGAFIMEDDKGKAAKAQLLVKDAIKLAVYAESFGGPLHMTDDITYFITHWEAEAYRSKK